MAFLGSSCTCHSSEIHNILPFTFRLEYWIWVLPWGLLSLSFYKRYYSALGLWLRWKLLFKGQTSASAGLFLCLEKAKWLLHFYSGLFFQLPDLLVIGPVISELLQPLWHGSTQTVFEKNHRNAFSPPGVLFIGPRNIVRPMDALKWRFFLNSCSYVFELSTLLKIL